MWGSQIQKSKPLIIFSYTRLRITMYFRVCSSMTQWTNVLLNMGLSFDAIIFCFVFFIFIFTLNFEITLNKFAITVVFCFCSLAFKVHSHISWTPHGLAYDMWYYCWIFKIANNIRRYTWVRSSWRLVNSTQGLRPIFKILHILTCNYSAVRLERIVVNIQSVHIISQIRNRPTLQTDTVPEVKEYNCRKLSTFLTAVMNKTCHIFCVS